MQHILLWWQDGVHVAKKDKEEMMTEEQKKVMRTQDIKYVEMKRVAEAKVSSKVPVTNSKQRTCTLAYSTRKLNIITSTTHIAVCVFWEDLLDLIQVLIKNWSDRCSGCQSLLIIYFQKIERLKGELHLLDADGKQNNKHTFFVDSAKEGKYHVSENFDWYGRHQLKQVCSCSVCLLSAEFWPGQSLANCTGVGESSVQQTHFGDSGEEECAGRCKPTQYYGMFVHVGF